MLQWPLFLVPASLMVIAIQASNHPLTPINYDLYHHTDELIKEVKDLVGRHPNELTLETWETENKGYLAEILVVTYRSGGQESEDDGKYRVLLSFGQHGRELITSEVALRLLKILSGEHEMPQLFSLSMNRTLKNLVVKVIPMENLNGRKLVEGGSYCERRNGRGVDINRNWSVDWGKKEKDYDPFEENPGIAPFSEPESQIMRKLGTSFNPHIWVNVHSGMEALFMPYDHKNTTPDGPASQTMKPLLDELNHLHCQDRCTVGSGGGSVGYFAHGTATDYIYDIIKVPMVFTFEIYGDEAASQRDCLKMFNPTDFIKFEQVLRDWSAAFLTLCKIGAHMLNDSGVAAGTLRNSRLFGKGKEWFGFLEMQNFAKQELQIYYKLLLVSSALLLFFACSRRLKRKSTSILPK